MVGCVLPKQTSVCMVTLHCAGRKHSFSPAPVPAREVAEHRALCPNLRAGPFVSVAHLSFMFLSCRPYPSSLSATHPVPVSSVVPSYMAMTAAARKKRKLARCVSPTGTCLCLSSGCTAVKGTALHSLPQGELGARALHLMFI